LQYFSELPSNLDSYPFSGTNKEMYYKKLKAACPNHRGYDMGRNSRFDNSGMERKFYQALISDSPAGSFKLIYPPWQNKTQIHKIPWEILADYLAEDRLIDLQISCWD